MLFCPKHSFICEHILSFAILLVLRVFAMSQSVDSPWRQVQLMGDSVIFRFVSGCIVCKTKCTSEEASHGLLMFSKKSAQR